MGRRKRRTAARSAARRLAGAAALAGLGVFAGCRSIDMDEPRLSYVGKADLQHYVDRASSVASPAEPTTAADYVATLPPHTVADRTHDEAREISLAECIHRALANSKVIRERGQFLAPTNPLLNQPEAVTSVFDPAIQETTVQFGNRGVEAALSDFDALLTSQMLWGHDERIQDTIFGAGQPAGSTLAQDTGQFNARLEKPLATGGTAAIVHNWDYEYNNSASRLFPSVYTGSVQAELRQPLLAGAGVEFNRIAGPQSRNFARTSGLSNGVLIARINNDIEVAEFNRSARNLVREVEFAYWNLYLAYRVYDAEVIARNSALSTWRLVEQRREQGLAGGGAAEVAQARSGYFSARARVEASWGDLLRRELELRRIACLPVNDGTILRPIDEPIVAEFKPDWYAALCEALTRRPELRRQKWQIKSLELQLAAAKNLAQPNLDFISRYRVNGFGDNLISRTDNDRAGTAEGLNGAYNTLLDGDQTGWDLGVELSLPVGLRSAKSQVRNYELRVAKARAGLSLMEHEVSMELASAFQEVDRFYKTAQTSFNARAAAEEQVRAYETRFELGGIGGGSGGGGEDGGGGGGGSGFSYLDLLLRSQTALAQSEANYWQQVIEYNQAIADLHMWEGTLLERNGVTLSEGAWAPKAYQQALRRAWDRSHALPNPLLHTVPPPFAYDGDKLPTQIPDPVAAGYCPPGPNGEPMTPPPAPAPAGSENPSAPPPEPERLPPGPEQPAPLPEPQPQAGSEPVVQDATGVMPAGGDVPVGETESADATPVRSRFDHIRVIRGINH